MEIKGKQERLIGDEIMSTKPSRVTILDEALERLSYINNELGNIEGRLDVLSCKTGVRKYNEKYSEDSDSVREPNIINNFSEKFDYIGYKVSLIKDRISELEDFI